jgi:anaerobic magnesium-protoporphyrin IX monomethyl ester cyclase
MTTLSILLVGSPKSVMGFDRATRLPNLGLNSLAAAVQGHGVVVRVLDLVLVKKDPGRFLLNVLDTTRPDLVGFSCMTFQYATTLKLAGLVRAHNKKTVIVLGGYHPTVEHENILNHEGKPVVDFIIRNEGEAAFSRLIEELRGGRNFGNIPSLSYVENGTVIHNPCGNPPELDSIKIPDRESRMIKKGFHILGNSADVVETSRGCVNHCKFCSIRQMVGPQFKKFRIERVVQDLQNVARRGTRSILLADDNITADANRFEALCGEIIHHRLNRIKFAVQATISGIKREPGLMEKMSEAGVDLCFLGIENVREENVHFLDTKRIQQPDTREIIHELHSRGVTVIGSFIIGNPGDTREIIYDNFHYANSLDIDIPLFLILTPFPGTEIRGELLKEKLVTNAYDYEKYDLFHANVKTRFLSSAELEKIRDEIAFKILKIKSRVWKLVSKYPQFSMNVFLNQLIGQPREIFGYLQGSFKE